MSLIYKNIFSALVFSISFIAIGQNNMLDVNSIHRDIVSVDGIGAREAGTKEEMATAAYITRHFTRLGLKTTEQAFVFGEQAKHSKNIIAETNPELSTTIILGAHFDSTAQQQGSLGATDNGAGIAAMLAIANKISQLKTLSYNVRFIAFGAEEVGLKGSKHYVQELINSHNHKNIIGMINFDTIAGGDLVYVHSAHTTPYKCQSTGQEFNSDTSLRDALLKASKEKLGDKNKYVIHPAYEGYPEGVTGSWSDHAPFACAGVPIAYVESTNFTINGKNGYDGYSQSTHPELWDCFDAKSSTACDRKTEKKWGNIWHSQYDKLTTLNRLFPHRVSQQLAHNVSVLVALLSNLNHYYQ